MPTISTSFSALSVEPMNDARAHAVGVAHLHEAFSALSVEPMNDAFKRDETIVLSHPSFSALSVEPMNDARMAAFMPRSL